MKKLMFAAVAAVMLALAPTADAKPKPAAPVARFQLAAAGGVMFKIDTAMGTVWRYVEVPSGVEMLAGWVEIKALLPFVPNPNPPAVPATLFQDTVDALVQ